MPFDFNPYTHGVKLMTPAEAQRNALSIVNRLNQGEALLSRDLAFLVGYSVPDLLSSMQQQKIKIGTKVLNCRYVYDKADVALFFNRYIVKGWRRNAYTGKRMDCKESRIMLQLVYNNLKG